MNLVRWDPFRELEGIQARLNRLFPDVPARFEDESLFAAWSPAVDIQETDNEFILKADLPDVKKDDVKVELKDGVLTVEGERKKERTYGRFVRHFTLPTEVDGPHIKAEFKDGVLNVRLPKAANAKPTAIEVKVA